MVVACLNIFYACEKSDELIEQGTEDLQLLESESLLDISPKDGYLVFKSIDILDSVANVMNKVSDEEQLLWEESMEFESARSYRAKLNNEIFSTEIYSVFLEKSSKAAAEGYFNSTDTCMDYPFSIYSWASVINKDGIVGIGDYLYSFDKYGETVVYKGNLELLNKTKEGEELSEKYKIIQYKELLKSSTWDDYGDYCMYEKKNGTKRRLRVYLSYDVIKVKKAVIDASGTKEVNIPDAVKFDIYCHQEHKGLFGWSDDKTHLYYRDYEIYIGGNYFYAPNGDREQYPSLHYSNSNPAITVSSNDLSNHYIELYAAQYPFELIENQPAPSISPSVHSIDFDIWTGKVGDEDDYIDFIVE